LANSIPTTFNDELPSYTAVGGNQRRASTGLSAVIINRKPRHPRYGFFEELEKAGFDYVLSMENSNTRYDLESLSLSFPFVRFILLKDSVSYGEVINLAASELSSPLFFVMRNDLKILRGGGAGRMAERLSAGKTGDRNSYKRLCTAPLLQDGRSETIPALIAPALLTDKNCRSVIKTIPFIPRKEGLPTLYPFDGIGIYDRERFIRLGGFDPSIKNYHWQLMDFGFRASLWGEEIAVTQLIKLSYEGLVPEEDSTADADWLRLYLKNLAPVFLKDYAHLPLRRFPWYSMQRGDFFSAWAEFSAARAWVKTNRFRFTSDARTITERWENFDAVNNSSEGNDAIEGYDDSEGKDIAEGKNNSEGKDGSDIVEPKDPESIYPDSKDDP